MIRKFHTSQAARSSRDPPHAPGFFIIAQYFFQVQGLPWGSTPPKMSENLDSISNSLPATCALTVFGSSGVFPRSLKAIAIEAKRQSPLLRIEAKFFGQSVSSSSELCRSLCPWFNIDHSRICPRVNHLRETHSRCGSRFTFVL